MTSQWDWRSPPGTQGCALRAILPPYLVRTLPPHAVCSEHLRQSLTQCPLRQSPTAGTTPGSSRHRRPASPSCSLPATVAPMAGPAGECPACILCPQAGMGCQDSLRPLLLCLFPPRCYELELQDCSLRDLSLIVSRQQPSPQETSFTCLLGEVRVSACCGLVETPAPCSPCSGKVGAACPDPGSAVVPSQVLDTASVAASPPQVHSVMASQLWWQEGPEPEQLSLSLTLRWSFPPGRARWFRVLSQGARCRLGQTAPQVLGLAQGCLFRAVGLSVPQPARGQSCRLELLVEPVLRDELPVDPERWGRLVLVYSAPGSGTSSDGH